MTEDLDPARVPEPAEFAAQLIGQVLADLEGVLYDGSGAAADAFALIESHAKGGQRRGALIPTLARAALAAHRALVAGWVEGVDALHDADARQAVAGLIPGAAGHVPFLFEQALRIESQVAASDPRGANVHAALAKAVIELYEGIRTEDPGLGRRGLLELRSMVVHLDSAAQAGSGDDSRPAARTIRPDRFHDYFMRFLSRAQVGNPAGDEQVIAALTRDGRLEALIAADGTHPVHLAADEVRDAVEGDALTKEHVLVRIRALLSFFGALRRRPDPFVGSPVTDQNAYLSLVVAGATAPLWVGQDFAFGPLAQIARYNQTLLRGARALEGVPH